MKIHAYDEHELARYFPLLWGQDYQDLKADIRDQGLLEPITLFEGKVLDGRNRLRVCKELGIEPKFRDFEGKGTALDFVISINLMRRALTPGQKAAVVARLTEDREAGTPGWDTVNNNVHGRLVADVAERVGVTRSQAGIARDTHQHRPEIFERLERGEINLETADAFRRVTPAQAKQLEKKMVAEDLSAGQAVRMAKAITQADEYGGATSVKALMSQPITSIPLTPARSSKPVAKKAKPDTHFSWVKSDEAGAAYEAIQDLSRLAKSIKISMERGDLKDRGGARALLRQLDKNYSAVHSEYVKLIAKLT